MIKRQIKTDFVTEKNIESLKSLNEKIFPILSVTEMNASFYNNFMSRSLGFAVLAFLDKKLAGAVCCQMVENNSLYVRIIGTLSRYRRKGVAAALMNQVIQEASLRQVNSVYAYVRADNKAAMFLNRKFGLSKKGECKQDQSLVIMERVF